MRLEWTRLLAFLAVGAGFSFVNTQILGGQTPPSESAVAYVEGRKITYKEIRMPEESLRLKYRLTYGKFPESQSELLQFSLLSEKTESELLMGRIRSILREKQIERLGIVVTDEELIARQRELYAGKDTRALLAKQREKLEPLMKALKAVLQKEISERQAYDTYLSPQMSYEEWLVHQQYYKTPERIAMLERLTQMTEDDLYKPDVGIRGAILDEKLNQRIDAQLSQTDSEFREYLDALAAKNIEAVQQFERKNPFYLRAKRAEWWRQQYAKANIQILDKKFADIVRLLLHPDN